MFKVSDPPVNINGPIPTLVRGAQVCCGVIVQVDIPTGTAATPTDLIQVIKIGGTGAIKYDGYNKVQLSPGTPGAPVRYSIFLCPTTAGQVDIEVGFVFSDLTIHKVPFTFNVAPAGPCCP